MDKDKTLVLDVSGKDRAAISIMHAYMRARGVDPNEIEKESGESLREAWIRVAQGLANNPDPDCSTGSFNFDWYEDWLYVLRKKKRKILAVVTSADPKYDPTASWNKKSA